MAGELVPDSSKMEGWSSTGTASDAQSSEQSKAEKSEKSQDVLTLPVDDGPEPGDPMDVIKTDILQRLAKSELGAAEAELLKQAVKDMPALAYALGPDRVCVELLPVITADAVTSHRFWSEENTIVLLDALGEMTQSLGDAEVASFLVPFIERYAGVHENTIREKALAVIRSLLTLLTPQEAHQALVAIVQRMYSGSGSIPLGKHLTVADLLPSAYQDATDIEKGDLWHVFWALSHDDTPLARKAGYTVLPKIIPFLDLNAEKTRDDIIHLLHSLCEESMESVRALVVPALAPLAPATTHIEFKEAFCALIDAITEDDSGKVKQELGKSLPAIAAALAPVCKPLIAGSMFPALLTLLHDAQHEVRAAAAASVCGLCDVANAETIKTQLIDNQTLELMQSDGAVDVREEIAGIAVSLGHALDKDSHGKLVQLVVKQMEDEAADARLPAVYKMQELMEVFGYDVFVDTIATRVSDITTDNRWRVRMDILVKLQKLTEQMGDKALPFFDKRVKPIMLSALSDSVHTIRMFACDVLCQMAKRFGEQWGIDEVLSAFSMLHSNGISSAHRIVAMLAMQKAVASFSPAVVTERILPVVIKGCKDSIINVRIAAVRSLETVLPVLDKELVRADVRALLEQMARTETDRDVVLAVQNMLAATSS